MVFTEFHHTNETAGSYIPIETNFIEQPLQVITMLMLIHYKYVYRRTYFRFPTTESVKVKSKKLSNKSMDQIQKMYLLYNKYIVIK